VKEKGCSKEWGDNRSKKSVLLYQKRRTYQCAENCLSLAMKGKMGGGDHSNENLNEMRRQRGKVT